MKDDINKDDEEKNDVEKEEDDDDEEEEEIIDYPYTGNINLRNKKPIQVLIPATMKIFLRSLLFLLLLLHLWLHRFSLLS